MARIESLNRNYLFQRAYRSKNSFVSPFVVTYVVKRRSGSLRIGITASKKIGCAVQRNRARRIVKAAAFDLLKNADGPFDIVLVCRKATVTQKSTRIEDILRGHLKEAGVLR